ncbi:MAG: S41 family peptidase [Clostridia bacterium]|nr:S41 family peptidase [Clostridia bacterium]
MDYKKIWSEVITASLIVVISAVAIISFMVISDQNVDIYNPSDKIAVSKGTDKISEVLNLIESKYMGEVDIEKLVDGAIEGIFENIDDPYTRYLTEEQFDEEINAGDEEYSGIGIHMGLNLSNGKVRVLGVMPETPAYKAGLKAGDIILEVGGTKLNKDNYNKASEKIKGKEGTYVKLLVERDGKEIEFSIVRKTINASNISSEVIKGTKIGYIKIFAFERNIYNQFKNEYDRLINKEKVEKLIIDVRDNPGGFVTDTIKIADLLCGEGLIIKEEYGDGTVKTFKSDKSASKVPFAILVNENSASASEILAGSIKDLKAGKVIGTKTFGKGIMQSYIELENGGGVAITIAKYYTASGNEIHGVGIEPDIKVELPKGTSIDYKVNPNTDLQLKEAINALK